MQGKSKWIFFPKRGLSSGKLLKIVYFPDILFVIILKHIFFAIIGQNPER